MCDDHNLLAFIPLKQSVGKASFSPITQTPRSCEVSSQLRDSGVSERSQTRSCSEFPIPTYAYGRFTLKFLERSILEISFLNISIRAPLVGCFKLGVDTSWIMDVVLCCLYLECYFKA